jgi:hypothetical protein
MVTVAVTQDDDVAAAVGAALGHVELAPLVRGKLVAVKPNETWASARPPRDRDMAGRPRGTPTPGRAAGDPLPRPVGPSRFGHRVGETAGAPAPLPDRWARGMATERTRTLI